MIKIPIAKPHIDQEDKKAVLQVLNSGQLSLGPKYLEFEQKVAQLTKRKYGCAVANGTCGLHLAVKALGLKEGDEVITSPFSFISSSNCLLFEKVKPVFVDIKEDTFNFDPAQIEAKITKKTKAILVVHIFSQSADMKEILRLAKKHHLKVIEDACEAIGSNYLGQPTGSLGDIAVFAFYPNKQMTTGEGGMIVTDNKKYKELCDSYRNQGRNKMGDWLIHERLGFNYRMDEMSAALGLSQLKKLAKMIKEKAQLAAWYRQYLQDKKDIILPVELADRTNSWFIYVIRLTNGQRNLAMEKLAALGIQTKPYLPVIHLQPFMRKQFAYQKGDFPVAEKVSAQTLALPFYIGLTKQDIKYICQELLAVYEG